MMLTTTQVNRCKFAKAFTFCFAVLTFAFYVLRFNCMAQSLSSNELINNAKQYDTKIVSFQGEVIGDIMKRGNYAWVNLNDGNSAIGIWMSESLAKQITYAGSFKSKGDIIAVEGVFHRACLEHGGDLDIHAQAIRKISSGAVVVEKSSVGKNNFAIIFLGVLGLIWISNLLKRK
jgi:hypothetical protein